MMDTNKYLIDVEQYGRTEKRLDRRTFASDLAPLFARSEPGPRFAVDDVASLFARSGGVKYSAAAARIRSYAQKGLIRTRDQGGRATSARLFAMTDIAAAKVLSNFQDAGFADLEILKAISRHCYTWHHGRDDCPPPVLSALAGVARGEAWCFRLDVHVRIHDQSHERRIFGAFYEQDAKPNFGPDYAGVTASGSGWLPTMNCLVSVNPHFLPVLHNRTDATAVERKRESNT